MYQSFLEFNTLFFEPRETSEFYFQNLSKRAIFLLLNNWLNESQFVGSPIPEQSKSQIDYLFHTLKKANKEQLISRLNQHITNNPNIFFIWINPYTTLELIELLLGNHLDKLLDEKEQFIFYKAQRELAQFKPSDYLQIIKGYLSQSQLLINTRKLNHNQDTQSFYLQQLAERLRTYEYENKEYGILFYIEILKGIHFFQFLEKKFPDELSKFLKSKNLLNWNEYISMIHELAIIFLKENRVRISNPQVNKRDMDFFDTMTIDKSKISTNDHFKSMKIFPLLKYDDHCYLSIYKVFVFEKIYKSLRFETIDINIIGKEFFEDWLCENLINEIFTISNYNLTDSSSVFKKLKIQPDQIIRVNNDVFLFEYKDTFLKDVNKHSEDSKRIIEELESKLFTKKGVGQLVNTIVNYQEFHHKEDSEISLDQLSFHPIIVVQDRSLGVPGLNKIINWRFNEQLENKLDGKILHQVNRLTIMNIDTLILCKGWFSEDSSHFKNTIEAYNRYDKDDNNKTNYSFSYDSWIKEVIISRNNEVLKKIQQSMSYDIEQILNKN